MRPGSGASQALELLERHGKPVSEEQFDTEDALLDAVASNLNLGEDGYETGAVITMTEDEAMIYTVC